MRPGSAESHHGRVGTPHTGTRIALLTNARRVFVHLGGPSAASTAETWELEELHPPSASYATFGSGCGGTSSHAPMPLANSASVDSLTKRRNARRPVVSR